MMAVSLSKVVLDTHPLSSDEIDKYLDEMTCDELLRYANLIGGQIGEGLRVRAQGAKNKALGKYDACEYLNQHLDKIHDWHSDMPEHNDYN